MVRVELDDGTPLAGINVKVNGEEVAAMNCDKFDQPGICPDGKKHKFKLKGSGQIKFHLGMNFGRDEDGNGITGDIDVYVLRDAEENDDGDNVYIDTPTVRATQQYCYYRRQSRPEFRSFVSSTAVYAIWDDHETSNNSWKDGAENHDPATEGDWRGRRRAALQAYYEWMPVREPEMAPEAPTIGTIESRLNAA